MFHLNDIGLTAYLDREDVEKIVEILRSEYPVVGYFRDIWEVLAFQSILEKEFKEHPHFPDIEACESDVCEWARRVVPSSLDDFISRFGQRPEKMMIHALSISEYSFVAVTYDAPSRREINVQLDRLGTTSPRSQKVGEIIEQFVRSRGLRPRYVTSPGVWTLLCTLTLVVTLTITGLSQIGFLVAVGCYSVAFGLRKYRRDIPMVDLVSRREARFERRKHVRPAIISGVLVAFVLGAIVVVIPSL